MRSKSEYDKIYKIIDQVKEEYLLPKQVYGIADREAELLTASAISNVFSPLNRFVDNAVKSLFFYFQLL